MVTFGSVRSLAVSLCRGASGCNELSCSPLGVNCIVRPYRGACVAVAVAAPLEWMES